MSVRANVLLWAQRTIARKGSAPHVLLEIAEKASSEQVQEAFHKIARTSHPDLHRTGLDPDELELVTSAYAAVAGAYQQMRVACMKTARIPTSDAAKAGAGAITPPDSRPVAAAARPPSTPAGGTRAPLQTPPAGARTVPGDGAPRRRPSTDPTTARPRAGTDSDQPPVHVAATASGAPPAGNAAQAMSAKALLYYRKAELCLKRGDLRGAVLQLKLACAADPNSGFLRTALAEVELEVRKTP